MKPLADIARTVFIVVVASATTLFVVQNLAPMEIDFLLWSVQAPRFIGVLVSLFLGIAVGVLLCMGRRPKP